MLKKEKKWNTNSPEQITKHIFKMIIKKKQVLRTERLITIIVCPISWLSTTIQQHRGLLKYLISFQWITLHEEIWNILLTIIHIKTLLSVESTQLKQFMCYKEEQTKFLHTHTKLCMVQFKILIIIKRNMTASSSIT